MNSYTIAQNNLPQSAPESEPAAPAPPPQPQAPVKVDAQWVCKTFALDQKGDPAGALPADITVGTKFLVSCEGPSAQLKKDSLALEVPKELKYQLKILQPRALTDTHGEFIATAWAPGEVKLQNPVLTDGAVRVGLGEFHFTVASVIDKKTNPESKPFEPWSPMKMMLPMWIYIAAVMVIALVIAGVALSLRRVFRRKALLRLLEANPVAMSPFHQFNKELRHLVRSLPSREGEWSQSSAQEYFQELDNSLRWFLARELVIPVFKRRSFEILRDLKRAHPSVYGASRRNLAIALSEIEKAKSSSAKGPVPVQDAHQIAELARNLASEINEEKED